MRITRVYLSAGSNIDPEVHLPGALRSLCGSADVVGVSTHYRTRPLNGRIDQDDYRNGVWSIDTDLGPAGLRQLLKELEEAEGRRRSGDAWEARTLDLDLVLYGDLIDRELGLPDEAVLARDFVHRPILELNPDLIWPLTKRPLRDMVSRHTGGTAVPDLILTDRLKGIIDGQRKNRPAHP